MPYATQTDMEEHCSESDLIALTDRADPPAGAIDADVLDAALVKASGLMDGYLKSRYVVPIAVVTADLTLRCVHIAYYLLHRDSAPDKVRKDYDDALRWLRDVADGRIVLTGTPAAAPEGSADSPQIDAPDRTFTSDNMSGF